MKNKDHSFLVHKLNKLRSINISPQEDKQFKIRSLKHLIKAYQRNYQLQLDAEWRAKREAFNRGIGVIIE